MYTFDKAKYKAANADPRKEQYKQVAHKMFETSNLSRGSAEHVLIMANYALYQQSETAGQEKIGWQHVEMGCYVTFKDIMPNFESESMKKVIEKMDAIAETGSLSTITDFLLAVQECHRRSRRDMWGNECYNAQGKKPDSMHEMQVKINGKNTSYRYDIKRGELYNQQKSYSPPLPKSAKNKARLMPPPVMDDIGFEKMTPRALSMHDSISNGHTPYQHVKDGPEKTAALARLEHYNLVAASYTIPRSEAEDKMKKPNDLLPMAPATNDKEPPFDTVCSACKKGLGASSKKLDLTGMGVTKDNLDVVLKHLLTINADIKDGDTLCADCFTKFSDTVTNMALEAELSADIEAKTKELEAAKEELAGTEKAIAGVAAGIDYAEGETKDLMVKSKETLTEKFNLQSANVNTLNTTLKKLTSERSAMAAGTKVSGPPKKQEQQAKTAKSGDFKNTMKDQLTNVKANPTKGTGPSAADQKKNSKQRRLEKRAQHQGK